MDYSKYDSAEKILVALKPFIAIAILILIVFSTIGLYKNNQLKYEVRESCGYERSEKVYCVCDKALISQFDINGNPYYNHSQNAFNFALDPEID